MAGRNKYVMIMTRNTHRDEAAENREIINAHTSGDATRSAPPGQTALF